MPKIVIQEDNQTRGTASSNTDIVFIPGFSTNPDDVDKAPKLYTSTAQFEMDFPNPVIFKADCSESDQPQLAGDIKAGSIDRSYVMAKELLSAGLSVYYYVAASYPEPIPDTAVFTPESFYTKGTTVEFFVTTAEKDPIKTILEIHKIEQGEDKEEAILVKQLDLQTSSESSYYVCWKVEHAGKYSFTLSNTNCALKTANHPLAVTSAFTTFNNNLDEIFKSKADSLLIDKNDYTIKYLTTGGYPNFWTTTSGNTTTAQGCYLAMLELAATRGDCIAMIEFPRSDLNSKIVEDTSYFKELYKANPNHSEYGTVFTPWHNYSLTGSYSDYVDEHNKKKISAEMPGCFGYLVDLAANIKTGPNWLAMAGINRGTVPGIGDPLLPTGTPSINNYMINTMQATTSDTGAIAINPIAEIKPYGYVLWGNRTLAKITDEGLNAHHFLNIRNMVCDIKKVCYQAAKSLLFEQNSEVLWLNFKAQVAPYLEQLKSGQGISDYKLIMLDTRYDGKTLPKETFACAIKIYPLYAVEEFEITIVLSDTDVSIN